MISRWVRMIVVFVLVVLAFDTWGSDNPIICKLLLVIWVIVSISAIIVDIVIRRKKPDYKLFSGARIWLDGVNVDPISIEKAINFFNIEYKKRFEIDPSPMYKDMDIRFTSFKLGSKSGLQKGNNIAIHYKTGFKSNGFFHELAHAVDEVILRKYPDYEHSNKEVWDFVKDLKARY